MFLLDNLLMAPGSAAFVIFKELARKAQEEWLDDDSVKHELQELYALLESGRISDRDFEARECRLLERLEQIARAKYRDKWGPDEPSAPTALPAAILEPTPVVEQELSVRPLLAMADARVTGALPSVEDIAAAQPVVALPPPRMDVLPPVAQTEAAPTPAPASAPALPAGASLSMPQVIESTTRALGMLKLRVSAITSVVKDDEGWKVTAELVERKGVPDTNDLLGMYELRLDRAGNVLRYERTRMRRRGDLNRS
jgi:hypothetical protein